MSQKNCQMANHQKSNAQRNANGTSPKKRQDFSLITRRLVLQTQDLASYESYGQPAVNSKPGFRVKPQPSRTGTLQRTRVLEWLATRRRSPPSDATGW